MTKFYTIILFIISTSTYAQIPIELQGCFNKTETDLLNNAFNIFEKKLTKYYKENNTSVLYQKYLIDYSKFNIPASFFFSPESKIVFDKLNNSTLLNKIWIKKTLEDLYPEDENIVEIKFDEKKDKKPSDTYFYIINPKGVYFKTLIKKNKNKRFFNEYLNILKQVPDLNDSIHSESLTKGLNSEDFKSPLIKFAICLDFYYNALFNFVLYSKSLQNK